MPTLITVPKALQGQRRKLWVDYASTLGFDLVQGSYLHKDGHHSIAEQRLVELAQELIRAERPLRVDAFGDVVEADDGEVDREGWLTPRGCV